MTLSYAFLNPVKEDIINPPWRDSLYSDLQMQAIKSENEQTT